MCDSGSLRGRQRTWTISLGQTVWPVWLSGPLMPVFQPAVARVLAAVLTSTTILLPRNHGKLDEVALSEALNYVLRGCASEGVNKLASLCVKQHFNVVTPSMDHL